MIWFTAPPRSARDFPQSSPLAANSGRSTCSAPARVSRRPTSALPVIPAKACAKAGIQGRKVSGVPLDPRFPWGDERNTSSHPFRVGSGKAFGEAGITHDDVDHLVIYDAFAGPAFGMPDPEGARLQPEGRAL